MTYIQIENVSTKYLAQSVVDWLEDQDFDRFVLVTDGDESMVRAIEQDALPFAVMMGDLERGDRVVSGMPIAESKNFEKTKIILERGIYIPILGRLIMDILSRAKTSARQAMLTCNIDNSVFEDDIAQEAAIGHWLSRHMSPQYAWAAGRKNSLSFIHRYIFGDKGNRANGETPRARFSSLDDEYLVDDAPWEISDQRLDILEDAAEIFLEIFQGLRKTQNQRALKGAVRDANITLLLLQGYSIDGIAHELNIPRKNAKDYISQVRKKISIYLGENHD